MIFLDFSCADCTCYTPFNGDKRWGKFIAFTCTRYNLVHMHVHSCNCGVMGAIGLVNL